MKCINCGAELKDGTLICSRCGARQGGGRNGGTINKNGKSNKGGGGKKVILSIVTLVLIAVGTIVGVGVLRSNKGNKDAFTHNTTFEKDNLSVTDDKTLRYREVDKTKTFSIGSDIGYVDVNIVDEAGSEVDFSINKEEKSGNYIIKPKDYWDNTHTYFMSLDENTFFTDEDMYQFKKVIYTVKKEKAEEPKYKLNSKIIYLNENPNAETKIGDVVIYIDEAGNEKVGKIDRIENGQPVYVEPSLVELFEELKVDEQNFYPDYSKIIWDDSWKQTMVNRVKQSKFLDCLFMTTYANDYNDIVGIVGGGVSGGLADVVNKRELSIDAKEIDNICKITIDASEELGNGNELSVVDKNLKENKYLKLTLGFELSPYNGKLFGKKVENDVKAKLEFSKKIAIVLKSHVDIDWLTVNAFDFQLMNYSQDGVSMELTWSKDGSDEDDADDAVIKHTINSALVNKEDILDTEEICKIIPSIPIPIAGPIGCEVDLSLKGNYLIEGNFKLDMTNEVTSRYGLELIRGQLVTTKFMEKNASTSGTLSGKLEAKVGVSPSFHLFIGAFGCNPVDVSINAELGVYGRSEGSFTIENNNIAFWEYSEDGNKKLALASSNYDETTMSSKLSMEAGIYVDAYIKGKVVVIVPLLDETIRLYYDEFPFAQISREDDYTNDITATSIGAVGSIHHFGPYDFKVLDKDEENGIALLLATEGIENKPYFVNDTNNIGIAYTWADSDLRKYLNDDFINKFDTGERNSLYGTKVVAEKNYKYDLPGGEDCYDKIFILSKSELEKYLHSDKERQLKATSVAVSSGAYVSTETNPDTHRLEGNTVYWVRNPGNMSFNVMAVNSDGSINEEGADGTETYVCVRPAMWVRYTIKRNIKERLRDITIGILDSVRPSNGGSR